jgi:hypothetical protein
MKDLTDREDHSQSVSEDNKADPKPQVIVAPMPKPER